ncbi:hypothetical protein HYDPIDRAFT_137583 [Hydnomerulius pinastri MD-312]|uniref:HECT-like ubiquitin-conjugating enzyme-binding-domain-containing protein n=1 Tax=Hydnomerulius pinastri MD-312 TaxID=994086 RepID=A0A0C9W4Z2_9AGAM|nr:hypothetical protein HYDPIDRAFT_137583 [Hydnomerulius pinastri MD-312]
MMATLVRTRLTEQLVHEEAAGNDLQSNIPAPFPSEHLIDLQDNDDDILDELAAEHVEYDVEEDRNTALRDIQPSIAAVQHSCLMTLNNLLSVSSSLPVPGDEAATLAQILAETPLSCLVYTLRTRDGQSGLPQSSNEAALLTELHDLVDALAPTMDRRDAHLAQAIVALLLDLEQLPASLALTPAQAKSQAGSSSAQPDEDKTIPSSRTAHALLSTLQRQLSSLQPSGPSDTEAGAESRPTPMQTIKSALLWTRIDEQLEAVVALCKDRAASSSPSQSTATNHTADVLGAQSSTSVNGYLDGIRAPSFDDHLPPEYESEYPYPYDMPPSYAAQAHARTSLEEKTPYEMMNASQYPPEKVSASTSTVTLAPPAQAEEMSQSDKAPSASTTALDLDLVTRAIDRLYAVAPQLADQRVELRREKIVQMEKAREGKGKGKARAIASDSVVDAELDKMLDLLGRASAREIPDQSVVIDPRRRGRGRGCSDLEEQRNIYIEHLVQRSSVGRLHAQDATLTPGRSSLGALSTPATTSASTKDADKNAGASGSTGDADTSPEGNKLQDSERASSVKSQSGPLPTLAHPTHKKSRSRSLSAPHLAWLRPVSRDRSGTGSSAKDMGAGSAGKTSSSTRKNSPSSTMSRASKRLSGKFGGASKSRPVSAGGEGISTGALDITYVAEHHETLKHVLVFAALVSSTSSASGASSSLSVNSVAVGTPSAEVLPSTSSATSGDWLLLRLAGTPSPPLALPVPVQPGLKEVLVRSGHWEVKVGCSQPGAPSSESEDPPLLTAPQLTSLSPGTYTCSSCSLPLVSAPPVQYRDLPSEHWEELVDAWMCHPEGQTLTKGGMNGGDKKGGGFGFWPTSNEALVGGSYVLFDAESVVGGNRADMVDTKRPRGISLLFKQPSLLRTRGDNTCLVRCLCGAIAGRRHDRKRDDGLTARMYRLFKYAIRPICATSEFPKIPMSAFVLQDMLEHVQAHATYRFVLSDEEEEKPRLLIWLFKPKIRISYMLPAPYHLPKSGSIDASKVLYKILGPTSSTTDIKDLLNKYPGFPQAEHLFYPIDVCRKLAAFLKESTGSYPENMRTMTGLDVGWLRRA